jgi:hypothetical protein
MANFNIDYLVVAGGGAGGRVGGGGGAGGYRTSFGTGNINGGNTAIETPLSLSTSTNYNITIGAGGSATTTVNGQSGSGTSSSISALVQSTGGGGAGNYATGNGASGGSGGGGASSGTQQSGGARVSNPIQGFVGGSSLTSAPYPAGGGGGASSSGGNGTGGSAMSSLITGTSTSYAGGGGGGNQSSYYGGSASTSGGGGGAGNGSGSSTAGSSAVNNTGSGGGGGGFDGANGIGGNGGSGVVILRYATADVAGYTVTGAAPTETTDGTDTVLSFTTVGTSSITFTAIFDGTKVTTPVTGFESGVDVGLKIPIGTNSNIPTGVEGMIRNDTDEVSGGTNSTTAITFYNGTDWKYFTSTVSPDVAYPTSLKMYLNASDTASYPGTGTTWFDLTSNGNNGTISNTTWNPGGYFDFNGSLSKVDLGTSFANNVSQATYSAWVNFDNLNTQNFIIFPDSGTTGHGFGFFDFGNGNIYFQSDNTTNSNRGSISNSGLYTAGSWVHMAQVYDGNATGNANRLKAYVNGSLLNLSFSGTIPSTTKATTYNTLVGTRIQGGFSLDGQISKVRIYDTALTQAEITALYTEGP